MDAACFLPVCDCFACVILSSQSDHASSMEFACGCPPQVMQTHHSAMRTGNVEPFPPFQFESLFAIRRNTILLLPLATPHPPDTLEIIFTSGTTRRSPAGMIRTKRPREYRALRLTFKISSLRKFFHPSFSEPSASQSRIANARSVYPSYLAAPCFSTIRSGLQRSGTHSCDSGSSVVVAVSFMSRCDARSERQKEREGENRTGSKSFALAELQHFSPALVRFRRLHSRSAGIWAFISGGAVLPKQAESFGATGSAVIRDTG